MADGNSKRERSIYATLLVPMIILVVAEVLLFGGILLASGAIARLDQNDRDILGQQVITRKDSLQNYLVGTVGDLRSIASVINAEAQREIDEGTLSVSSIGEDLGSTNQLARIALTPLIETMREKKASGAFAIFNSQDLSLHFETGSYGKKPGIFIHDMDASATPSARNEDLAIERASTDVVQSFQITTGTDWLPTFDFSAGESPRCYDYFYLPWQTAYDADNPKEATDYAYWGVAPVVGYRHEDHMLTYTIPLILEDGTVYGVVGVELDTDYLRTLLPSAELLRNEGASYILAVTDASGQEESDGGAMEVRPVVASGMSAFDGLSSDDPLLFDSKSATEFTYRSGEEPYFASCQFLRVYNTNSPFEHERWVLAGLVPEATLHRFGNHVRNMVTLASLLMAALGIVGSVLAARSISKPIKGLSSDVANAQLKEAEMPVLARTGISEVDQLTGAITSLSNDIASVKQLEQQRIEHERDYDLLTGLMNRRALYREANKLFASPSTIKHAALIMMDLDNLKELNDAHGHDFGDKYIYQAGRCFEDSVPPSTLVVRISGDEFVLLMYGFDSREELEGCIDELRAAVPRREIRYPDGSTGRLSASGGVAFYPDDGMDFIELMKLADFAMYQTKIAGKNNIGYFDIGTYQEQSTVQKAMSEFEELITDNEIADYHFQPIFDLRTGEVFAYEALMRVSMQNLRSPMDVVTLARQEQRLVDVERMTWRRSFACYGALLNRGEVSPDAYLFVNSFANVVLSESELLYLSQRYPEVMAHAVIEITEAENMDEDVTAAKRVIPGFSGLFALDDYGSGYNSEVMLLDLKPKFVKVDITIVRDIDTSTDKQRIMSNVVAYAHERDMLIVAEGVETPGELATCQDLDVDLAQGFYLARPSRVPDELSPEARAQLTGE